MIFQGIALSHALIGAGIAVTALAALQFLRVRHPGRNVPSVMLWSDCTPEPRRRKLFRRFARIGSMIPSLIAILATAAALAEPVVRWRDNPPRTVVIAESGAWNDARRLLARLDPLHTALVVATGGGVIGRDFGEAPLPLRERDFTFHAPDMAAVEALAGSLAGADGVIVRAAAEAPAVAPRAARPTMIHTAGALRDFARHLPGVVWTDDSRRADWSGGTADAALLYRQLNASGLWGARDLQHGQQTRFPAVELPRRGAVRTAHGWFALALLALAIDFILWHKRKIV